MADSLSAEPLESVTIALHFPRYTTAFKTTSTTEEGVFTFTELPLQRYDVVISRSGYAPKTITVPLPGTSTADIGTILLSPLEKSLHEVRVTAGKTLIRYDADKMIYQVDADPDRLASSTHDILRKLPGIVIDAEDNIELNGSASFQVLLNGRPSSMFVRGVEEVLKSLPATSVKSIEVITAPSAKYDSEGSAGIINIVTQSKIMRGYTVSLRTGYSDPGGPTTGGNLTARVGKFGLTGMWSYSQNQSPVNTNAFFRTDKRNHVEMVQLGESRSRYNNLLGNAELTYQFTEASLLSAHYNRRQGEGNNNFSQNVEMMGTAGTLLQAYDNISRGMNNTRSEDYGFDLQLGDKKKKDRLLTLSAKEVRDVNGYRSHNSLQPRVNTGMSGGRGTNESYFRERTAQADYTMPMGKQLLEAGIKRIERENSSDYFFERYIAASESYTVVPNMSNEYINRQAVNVGYVSLALRLGKWMVKGGSRLEHFSQHADFITSGTVATASYRNVLPSASVSRRLGTRTNMNLSYTQRLQRPSLFYLNPFINNNDPYNLFYGNPDLQPTVSHNLNMQFNTSVKRTYFNFNAYRNFTNGTILNYTTIGADTVAHSTYGNIGSESSTGGSLGLNFSIGDHLSFGFSGSGGQLQYTTIINNKLSQTEGFNYSINHNGGVTAKGWRMSYNAGYTSARISAQGKTIGYYNHTATLSRSFFKEKKGSISLTASNPFQPIRINRTEFDQPLFHQVRHSEVLMRRYTATFNYRFGKLQAGVKQKKRGIVNDDLMTSSN